MSWFPNFLSPLPAIIAAGIAIPSLLVLYFLKLKRRELTISSTLLWKKAIQDLQVNAPFQKLRRNLLLLLQLLLLALLCLALSRPVSNYSPGAGKTSIILIDRSASMNAVEANGKTRLDEAKRKAKELVGTMGRNATATVIAFDDKAVPMCTFTSDAVALRNAIDAIKPTDRPTRLKLAYQLAEAQLAIIPEQLRPGAGAALPDVWLFSDGRALDQAEANVRANVKYEKIGSDEDKNIAIVALSAKRNYERPTEVQVFARLANYGPKPENAQVQLSVEPIDPATGQAAGSSVHSVAGVELAPERWSDDTWNKAHPNVRDEKFTTRDSVEFKLDISTAAVITVEQMSKEGDALAADDVAHVVIPPPKALSVLLVTDGNPFLERLLDSLNLQKPAQMLPSGYEAKIPTEYDLIIFDRYSPKQLPPNGNFIYFGGVPQGLKLKPVKDGDKNVMLTEVTVLDWNRDHPILRGISLNKVYAEAAIKLDVPLETEVLVDGSKGPLLVLHREGQSMHLVCAFDILPSTWPVRPSFPVFMYQALQFMAVGADMDLKQSLQPGATPKISRTNLQKLGKDVKKIQLNGPGGSREVDVKDTGDFVLPPLDFVGVYSTDPSIPQYERIAVNLLDPNESNLVPVEHPPGGVDEAMAVGSKKSRLELWWWIVACAALPLLLIEWWVYTRRVHL